MLVHMVLPGSDLNGFIFMYRTSSDDVEDVLSYNHLL